MDDETISLEELKRLSNDEQSEYVSAGNGKYKKNSTKSQKPLSISSKTPVSEPKNYSTVQKKEDDKQKEIEHARMGVAGNNLVEEAGKRNISTNAARASKVKNNKNDKVEDIAAKEAVQEQYKNAIPDQRNMIDSSTYTKNGITDETKKDVEKSDSNNLISNNNVETEAADKPNPAPTPNSNEMPTPNSTPQSNTGSGTELDPNKESDKFTQDTEDSGKGMKDNTATNTKDLTEKANDALKLYDNLVKQGLDVDELPRSIVDAYKRGDFGPVGSKDAKHAMIYYIGDTISNALNNFGNTALKIAGKGGGENKDDAFGTYLGKEAEAAVNRRTAAKDQKNKMIQDGINEGFKNDTAAIKEINDFERSKLKDAADDKLETDEYLLKAAYASELGDKISILSKGKFDEARALSLTNGLNDTDWNDMMRTAGAESAENTDLRKSFIDNSYNQLTLDKNFSNDISKLNLGQKNNLQTLIKEYALRGDYAGLENVIKEQYRSDMFGYDIAPSLLGSIYGILGAYFGR